MSKISPKKRQFEIKKKRKKREKIKKLKERYLQVDSEIEKKKIKEKIKKIAPYIKIEEFLK